MTTILHKAGLGPRLNDLELGNYLSTVIGKAREINELSANRRANGLMDCLAAIQAAAQKAQWRLTEICDEHSLSQQAGATRAAEGR